MEDYLEAVKAEQYKLKSKEYVKPVISRYAGSQVRLDERMRENFKSVKSHRMTPNNYLGREASRSNLLDDLTDRYVQQ